MWISPDPARQFASLYSYTGNGFNPVNGVDPDGNAWIYSRGLGSNGNASNVYGPLRHDQIFFDNPTLIDGGKYSNYGMFGDNGIFSIPAVYRAENSKHLSYLKDYVGMGWLPDRHVARAIEKLNDQLRYSLGYLDCQDFAKDVFKMGYDLFYAEVQFAAEHHPMIVNLLDE